MVDLRCGLLETFVRAWRDGDGDGIGDLRGLTQGPGYLQDLGISGICLMPITKSADGDHGHATIDFRDIAPEYGTRADFDEFLAQAHRRGNGVAMGCVINHGAAQHPMFTEALKGPGNPFRDGYAWSETMPAAFGLPRGWGAGGARRWRRPGQAVARAAVGAGAGGQDGAANTRKRGKAANAAKATKGTKAKAKASKTRSKPAAKKQAAAPR